MSLKMLPSVVDRIKSKDLDLVIIHEIYDSENAHEKFEIELEKALEEGSNIIVIEPSRLGDETARWIAVGNCLQKTAAFSGILAIGAGLIWTDRPIVSAPLGVLSLFCMGLYTVSWQLDPCSQYQVEPRVKELVETHGLSSRVYGSPIILVRQNRSRRNLLNATVTLIASAFCAWRLYDVYK